MRENFLPGFQNYLKTLGYSDNTCLGYLKDIELYYKETGEPRDCLPDVQSLLEYLVNLAKHKLSPATQERKKASLLSYSNYLNMKNKNQFIDSKKIPSPKKPKKIPKHLLPNEIKNVLESIDRSTEQGHRDYLILLFFYSTGLRLSELLPIKPGQVNLKDRSIKVLGKGSKERVVFLPEKVLDEYIRYETRFRERIVKNNRIFLNAHGKALTPRGVEYIFEKIGNRAGLDKKLHPHLLRHTFATQILENGADIRKVGEFLGHSSLNTTQKYTHLNRKKLKETLDRFHPHA